jgi:hypothetical protein
MAGVFVAETAGGVRVAVTGAGEDGVFRHEGMEAALVLRLLGRGARRCFRRPKTAC